MSALPQTTTTNATQKKERRYAELATALSRMSRAIAQTADLCEQVHMDLQAMRDFAGIDASKFMTVAAQINKLQEDDSVDDPA